MMSFRVLWFLGILVLSMVESDPISLAAIGNREPTPQAVEPVELRLWAGTAPGAHGDESKDIPTAIVYLPGSAKPGSAKPTGAMVIFPGGGYRGLAMDHEGHQIARWANSMGMAGVIVNYRHRGKGYGHPCPMLDAQRAIRVTRANAEKWNIDPNKVGVLGFSAGGHLATTVLTHFDGGNKAAKDVVDRQSSLPDFGVVCYAVVAFDQDYTHMGSQRNLLGPDAGKEIIKSLSNEKHVKPETPPCFVWHTAEDKAVPVQNSLAFYSALVEKGVPSELHVFPKGRHGIGLGASVAGADKWPELCHLWLQRQGFAK